MNVLRSPEDIIRIPSTPSEMLKLLEQVHHPDQLDKVVTDLHIPSFLLNFYLATPADLSSIGLGKAVHIPVQITEREGGRKSLYYLNQEEEEVLAGIFVTNQGIALSFIKRDTGNTLPAQTGDLYSTRLTNLGGEVILQEQAELEVIEPSIGFGRLNGKIVDYCILWSIIHGPGYFQTAKDTILSYYGDIESQDYSTAYKWLDASRATLGNRPLTESLFLETTQALDTDQGQVSAFTVTSIIDTVIGGSFIVHVTRRGQSYDVHLVVEPPWLNDRNVLLISSLDNI